MPKQRKNSAKVRQRHLKPFKPGQSGNPKGRPRNLISQAMKAVMQDKTLVKHTDGRGRRKNSTMTMAEAIARGLAKRAKAGNVAAAELLLERVEGKIAAKIQIEGKREQLSDATAQELVAVVESLAGKLKNAHRQYTGGADRKNPADGSGDSG